MQRRGVVAAIKTTPLRSSSLCLTCNCRQSKTIPLLLLSLCFGKKKLRSLLLTKEEEVLHGSVSPELCHVVAAKDDHQQGPNQGQEDGAPGLPRSHHLHLRHRYASSLFSSCKLSRSTVRLIRRLVCSRPVPGRRHRRAHRPGHRERPIPRHGDRRHHRSARLHRGRRLLHPGLAVPQVRDLEHLVCGKHFIDDSASNPSLWGCV
jgi:hypothetical protein